MSRKDGEGERSRIPIMSFDLRAGGAGDVEMEDAPSPQALVLASELGDRECERHLKPP